MGAFSTLKTASAILLLSTAALLFMPRSEESRPNDFAPPDGVLRVSFEDIRIGNHARGKIRYDASIGSEFKASVWGSERARVAMDKSLYWFWIRDHDSKRHYESPVESVGKTDLIPPLRPSFLIWVLNDSDSPIKFTDGDYDVEVKVRGGSVAEQTYTRDGVIEARVVVKALQRSSGRDFPALATLEIDGRSIEIIMGPANTSSPAKPNTQPPDWSKASRIGL